MQSHDRATESGEFDCCAATFQDISTSKRRYSWFYLPEDNVTDNPSREFTDTERNW